MTGMIEMEEVITEIDLNALKYLYLPSRPSLPSSAI